MEQDHTWFRVVGFGLSGSVARSPEGAWKSFFWWGRRVFSYADHQTGTAINAHSAAMIEATTRRAAREADISTPEGIIGRGHWRRSKR